MKLIIENGTVIDPANGINALADVGVDDEGMIVAVALTSDGGLKDVSANERINAKGKLVCPGLIDLHVHVFEWVTNFGVPADDAGVHSGVTTVIDQGSTGPWTFGGFNAYVIKPAYTDVRAFVSVNVAGALMGGMKGDILHNPSMSDVDALVDIIRGHAHEVRGIKCHGESGALSHWGTKVLEDAARAGREAQVPLYVHTGQLFPVIEESRPEPRSVLGQVLPLLKEGDILAHIYSSMPDGIIGNEEQVPEVVYQARDKGVHFDIGYGINFSYRIARMMLDAGVPPHCISSDIHGDFTKYHDMNRLDYSMIGAMSRLWSLGMSIDEVIRASSLHPAQVIGESRQLGHLSPGSIADISILDVIHEPWSFLDGRRKPLRVEKRLAPWITVKAGRQFQRKEEMLPDVFDSRIAAKPL